MPSFSSCGRRIGAYALCLYIVGLNVFAAGDPGDGNTLNCGTHGTRSILLYAVKMDEITKFENIEAIYHRAAQLQSPLKKIAEAVPKSEDPPEKKEALQHLCNECLNDVERIMNATKDYAERGRMLREAREIIIEFKSGSPTIMRSNELNKAMNLLDQSFECKHRLLSDIHQNDMFEYIFRLLDIKQFVNTHKVPEPSAKEGEIMAGKVNDAPKEKPPFYYGNAPDRTRTDPQYLSDTLNIIRADLNKIDVILRDPLMEDKGSVDAVNNILSYFHKFEVKAPDFVKFVSQCLDKFDEETHLFKKRDTIIKRLNALDLNSHKAIPYLKQYKKVESQIYELLTLKETIVLEDLQREVSQVLYKLPQLVDDIKRKKRNMNPPPLPLPRKSRQQPPLPLPRKSQEPPPLSQPAKSQEQPPLQSIEIRIPTLDEASRESVKHEGSGGAVKSTRFRNHHELTSGVAKVGINSFGIILALGVIGAL